MFTSIFEESIDNLHIDSIIKKAIKKAHRACFEADEIPNENDNKKDTTDEIVNGNNGNNVNDNQNGTTDGNGNGNNGTQTNGQTAQSCGTQNTPANNAPSKQKKKINYPKMPQEDVELIQEHLDKKFKSDIDIDGKLGPSTTKAFQKAYGLKVDGIFGPATLKMWNSVITELKGNNTGNNQNNQANNQQQQNNNQQAQPTNSDKDYATISAALIKEGKIDPNKVGQIMNNITSEITKKSKLGYSLQNTMNDIKTGHKFVGLSDNTWNALNRLAETIYKRNNTPLEGKQNTNAGNSGNTGANNGNASAANNANSGNLGDAGTKNGYAAAVKKVKVTRVPLNDKSHPNAFSNHYDTSNLSNEEKTARKNAIQKRIQQLEPQLTEKWGDPSTAKERAKDMAIREWQNGSLENLYK